MRKLFMILVILSAFTELLFAQEPTLKIGMSISMSGPFSQEVGPFKELARAWETHKNKGGGISIGGIPHRVEFVVYDDRSDQTTVRTAYERLIRSDAVDLLLGPYSSPLTFAASIPAEEMGKPFLAICGNSPKIYERNFKWLLGILDMAPNYTIQYWEMIKKEGKIKTVAFVVEDSMHPKGVYAGSKELAEKAGFKIVYEEIIPTHTQDFSSTMLKIKLKNPDLIFVSANIHFAIAFMKQAQEKKLDPIEFHCIHHGGIFRKALGDFSKNVVGQMYWVKGMKTRGSQEFLQLLENANIDPYDYPWSVVYFAAFQTLEQGLLAAKDRSPEGILKALKDNSYETICGQNSFSQRGVGKINPFPTQIQDGTYEVVWPQSLATGPHIYRR